MKRLLGAQWLAIAFVGGVSFVLSVFIARRFGPETFGVYAQAISLGALLGILIDGGFGKLLIRETVRASPVLATRVRQLNAQVIDCYEPEFKNVYYKRESCCG